MTSGLGSASVKFPISWLLPLRSNVPLLMVTSPFRGRAPAPSVRAYFHR